MDKILGFLFLLLGCGVIVLMIYTGISEAVTEWCEETAQEIAEERYREWVRNTRFRIVQRLEIKDETKEVHS